MPKKRTKTTTSKRATKSTVSAAADGQAENHKQSNPDKLRSLRHLLTPQAIRKTEKALANIISKIDDPHCSEILIVERPRGKQKTKGKSSPSKR